MANIKVSLMICLELKRGAQDYNEIVFLNNFFEFVQNQIISPHTEHKKLDVAGDCLIAYLTCDDFCSVDDKIILSHLVRNKLIYFFDQHPESINEITFELTETISNMDSESDNQIKH